MRTAPCWQAHSYQSFQGIICGTASSIVGPVSSLVPINTR